MLSYKNASIRAVTDQYEITFNHLFRSEIIIQADASQCINTEAHAITRYPYKGILAIRRRSYDFQTIY
jgi:hypothetical protein